MRVLMCDPLYFKIEWENKEKNPHMRMNNQPRFSSKLRQWGGLIEIYRDHGVHDDFISSVPGLSDMVFAANAGWMYRGVFYASRMIKERIDETVHYAAWFSKRGLAFRYTENPNLVFEGQGDIITTRDAYLYCHGSRNSANVPQELERMIGELDRPMLTLRLLPNTGFYHGDLALFYIRAANALLYCPYAFDAKSLAIIEKLDCDKYPVPKEFALPHPDMRDRNFPLNAVAIGSTVVIPWSLPKALFPKALYTWLTDRGIAIVFHDFSEFGKSGAGVRCVTLILEE